MLVTGPNGAGKTNLVEGIHLAAQGFSFRTRSDPQLIRIGVDAAAAAVEGTRDRVATTAEVRLSRDGPRRLRLDGAAVTSSEALRSRIHVLVFTPDRLGVVKGGPAARRAYLDRALARLLPARHGVPGEYATAVSQRNAALRRAAAGLSTRDAVEPWTAAVAVHGEELVAGRRATIELVAESYAETAAQLGLPDAGIEYAGEPPTVEQLEARLDRDLERGTTGLGPHLDDVRLVSGDRDLRLYGSQGEQRLAVLSLILAEAAVLAEQTGSPPLLLLDDALSELDAGRRRILSARLAPVGQTIVTATGAEALPLAPAQVLVVSPGDVRPG